MAFQPNNIFETEYELSKPQTTAWLIQCVRFYLIYSHAHTTVNQKAKDSVDFMGNCVRMQLGALGIAPNCIRWGIIHTYKSFQDLRSLFMGFVFSFLDFSMERMNEKQKQNDALFYFFLNTKRYMTPGACHFLRLNVMAEILSRFYHCGKMRWQFINGGQENYLQ